MLRAALLAMFLLPLGCGVTPIDSTIQREGNKVTHDAGGGPADGGCGGGPHDGGWVDSGGDPFDGGGYPTDIATWPVDLGPWTLDGGHTPNDFGPVDLGY